MKSIEERAAAYDRQQEAAKFRRIKQKLWIRKAKKLLRDNLLVVDVSDDEVWQAMHDDED